MGARDPNSGSCGYMASTLPLGCFPAYNWFLNEQVRSLWERHTLWETAQHWSHFPSDLCRTLSLPPLPQGTGGKGAHLLQGHRLAARVLTEGIPLGPLGPLSSLSVCLSAAGFLTLPLQGPHPSLPCLYILPGCIAM